MRARSWCASSIAATWSPACSERQRDSHICLGGRTNVEEPARKPMARILIAEDEESIRNLVTRALRQDGHEVSTANDGAEALDLLMREKGAFELLLTDIRMPVMDGIALALAAAR